MLNFSGVAIRNRVEPETRSLIEATKSLYFTTGMSKGFDESMPTFGGVYGGFASTKEVREAVESADCVLWIGAYNVRTHCTE